MIFGVAFFSYVMGSFIDIVRAFDELFGKADKSNDLHIWLKQLNRYRNNTPLDRDLFLEIDRHFRYYW